MITVVVNKYRVSMYEFGKNNLSRTNIIVALSEQDAIDSTIKDKWWYEEEEGIRARNLVYPLTFRVEIFNH